MAGRTSDYTAALADEIAFRVSEGETLRQICRDDHMPAESTVRRWVLDDREGFATLYSRARDLQIDVWADDIIEIAEDGRNDWMERETKSGRITVVNDEAIQRSRLRIDTKKWLLSKLKPERYGDKLELSGKLDFSKKTDEQLDVELARLLAKASGDQSAEAEAVQEAA